MSLYLPFTWTQLSYSTLNAPVGLEKFSPKFIPKFICRDFPPQQPIKGTPLFLCYLILLAIVTKSLYGCVCGCWGKVIYKKSDGILGALGTYTYNAYVDQINTLYVLALHNVTRQLYFNKGGGSRIKRELCALLQAAR